MIGPGRTICAAILAILGIAPLGLGDGMELKVTRVALFSSGVGYFECDSTVTDIATAELKFRIDQINDILKSLVVQDFDGGTVGTVGYASRDPIEKTLRSFGVDITGKPTLGALLDQLRGEPVEIAGPRACKGGILGIEKQQVPTEKNPVEVDVLNVLTESGLQQIRLDEMQGIKLTDEKVDAELRKALAALAASHDAGKKAVTIRFDGQGKRRVRASYLLEAPIWKTSYRLILAPDKKLFLQGWATVENATEEDWKDVKLSLVSGRPISFTMDLYTPLYVRRPREELELYASLRPPEYAAGIAKGELAVPAAPAAAPVPAAKPQAVARRAGRPVALADRLEAREAEGVAPAEERLRAGEYFGRAGVESVAKAEAAGELFQYVIDTPVSISRQNSAMLPIVNQEIAGEKLSIFNPATHPKHPLNGLQMENTSGLNLMQGPVTIFDDAVYAGDAKLPDLRPGEKRLIGYALDLAVDVMTEQKPVPADNVSLRIVKGTMWHRHRNIDERTYNIKNKDKKDRTVLIEQGYGDDWTLIAPKESYERAQNLSRFKVVVPAGKTVAQNVRIERVTDESIALTDCGLDQITMRLNNLSGSVMSPAVKAALEKVVAMRTDLDRIARDRAAREKEAKESVDEQARVRENLKTLQQNSDPYQRQLKKFDALETQIEQLRGQISELRKEEENKRKELENYLLSLTVE
jgi:hypothetical protein